MSALLQIGEAEHKLLNADAEIAVGIRANNDPRPSQREAIAALSRARAQLTEARAALGAVRFVLRSQALAEALAYHEAMESRLRFGAAAMRGVINNPLSANADLHATRAKVLRSLVGGGS